jgi:hypothetical protein
MTAVAPRRTRRSPRSSGFSVAWFHQWAITATAFVLVALSWSPLLPGLFKIPFSVTLMAVIVIYTVLTSQTIGLDLRVTLPCLLLLPVCILMAALGESSMLLFRIAPLPMLIFAAWQTRRISGLPERLCEWLTMFLGVGIVGAILGFVYALNGGEPSLTIFNIDGRENGLYLSTMSNTILDGIIRPSFIYDEPGAFSFILCATVALREVLGLKRLPSYLLLIGGLITFSLAHILITFIYLVFRIGLLKAGAILATVLVLLAPLAQTEELEFFLARFAIEDGQLVGDNRSNQFQNFLTVVHPSMILFGDVECHQRPDHTCEEHGDISSSPVTPVYRAGIVALVVQIAAHAGLVAAFLRSKQFRFSALALTLLLLQRPFFEISGYGFITFLLIFLMLKRRATSRLT